MRAAVNIILIVGFLLVDFLIFHDLLKPGETYAVTDWLVGTLSIGVFYIAADSLLRRRRGREAGEAEAP